MGSSASQCLKPEGPQSLRYLKERKIRDLYQPLQLRIPGGGWNAGHYEGTQASTAGDGRNSGTRPPLSPIGVLPLPLHDWREMTKHLIVLHMCTRDKTGPGGPCLSTTDFGGVNKSLLRGRPVHCRMSAGPLASTHVATSIPS